MDDPKDTVPVPFSSKRFINHSIHRFYYAFGNTPAEDLLEHVPDTVESPSVLQLGCGDIRSCLYTIWKNFDEHCGHGNFKGVTFHLNDYCAAVLARNVLFLCLITKLENILSHDQKSLEVKQMVCAIWNIWFCHDLQPSQVTLLKESLFELSELFKNPESWSRSDNPLKHFVAFFEESHKVTFHEICSVFKMWLKMLTFSSSKVWNLKHQKDISSERAKNVPLASTFELHILQATQKLDSSPKKLKLRSVIKKEIDDFINTGNAHSEALFGLESAKVNLSINPTFYEKEDEYTLHYSSLPYECFSHSLLMTMENIAFPEESLIVDQKSFVNAPLHSNSFQQFTLWLVSTAKCLASSLNKPKISVVLNLSDAIAAAVELGSSYNNSLSFDVIHASNLIDHLSSLAIIVTSIPLLKSTGVLLTSTFLHCRESNKNLSEFIEMTLGFKMENLGMFGIRCIGQEGAYTGDGILCPTPAFQKPFQQYVEDLPRSMIWTTLANTPQCLPLLEYGSVIACALYTCIKASAYCIFRKGFSTISAVGACTQSSMRMILLFLHQLSSNSPVNEFQFWAGLCSYLKFDPELRPFLLHLQSQAILMNIHMHITVDERDCPLCNAIPLERYFKWFKVKLDSNFSQELMSNSATITLICLHHKKIDLPNLDLMNTPSKVFLFDSCPTSLFGANMFVDIVIPKNVVDTADYSVSVYFHNFYKHADYFLGRIVSTVPLVKAKTMGFDYHSRHYSYCLQPNPSSSFGSLIQFEYAESFYKIDISLSEEVLSNLMEKSILKPEKISNTEIKISCENLAFSVKFNMPVNYGKLSIKYSKKRKLVMINAPCKPFMFEDHLLLHLKDPHNNVILPEISFKSHAATLEQAAQAQLLTNVQLKTSADSLPANVKKFFVTIFQSHQRFFCLTAKKPDNLIYGLITIHKRCFDVHNQTVALDTSYLIKKDGIDSHTYHKLCSDLSGNQYKIEINKNELDFIENVLRLYHNRTRKIPNHSSPQDGVGRFDNNPTSNVTQVDDHQFYQAVVYHLSSSNIYNVPSKQKLDSLMYFDTTTKGVKCSYCKAKVNKSLRCTICLDAVYCSVGCQLKDADRHLCTLITSSYPASTRKQTQVPLHLDHDAQNVCNFCQKELKKVLKCSRCRVAMYCGKECQIQDWPNHKKSCRKQLK